MIKSHKNKLCCRIHSRHKGTTLNKSFIQLNSSLTGHESIDDWYCDCKSGSRTIGCCSHVTAIILYFKNEKYSGNLKNSSYKTEIKSAKKNPNSSRLEISKLINSSKDQSLNQCVKRELSSQTLNTISNIAKKNHDFQEKLSSNSGYNFSYYTTSHHSNVISRLTSHLPKWGGLCVLTENHDNFGYNRLKIVNTCSIDYFLLTFWVSKILDQNIINILEEHRNSQNQLITIINEIINHFGSRQWNKAKSLLIIDA